MAVRALLSRVLELVVGEKLDNKWVSVRTFKTNTRILDFCDGLLMVAKRNLNYGRGEPGFNKKISMFKSTMVLFLFHTMCLS